MKAAIYCRLSEEDRNKVNASDDSNSIQNQKSMLEQYASEQGWEIFNVYSDDDYTGSDRHRPEFNRLLQDAEHHKFDIILCKTQSRFTRELELVEKYIHGLFPTWNIRFVSIVDNADTANLGNKKSRQINGLVNEWYLEDMSENIRSVLTNRRKNGFHIGSFALYGYKKDPSQKGHLMIDPEAAAVVREVFTMFSQGYGKTAIARTLNDRNIPNPTEYKRLQGFRFQQPKEKNSTLWKYHAISDMLTNEMYIGRMVQGKYGSISYKTKQNKPRPKSLWYIVEGTHDAIIEQELWDKVQVLISQRAKPFSVGTIGLFARKARCLNCGSSMCSSATRGRHYLQCANRHVSKEACLGSFISVDKLEQIILDELRRLFDAYLDKDELERSVELAPDLQEQAKQLKRKLDAFEEKASQYAKGIRELYLDKVKGLITQNDFIELTKDFTGEKARLEQARLDCQTQIAQIHQEIVMDGTRKERIAQYLRLDHLTREIVDELIDYICVGKRIPGAKDVPVEIHWNF